MAKTLFVTWRYDSRESKSATWGPVGRLDYHEGEKLYRFYYTKGAKNLEGFQPFTQMEDLNQVYESSELFPIFSNRLLSPSRPEYEAYLRWGDLSNQQPDPIAILGVTEGRRQTDAIEVFIRPERTSEGTFSIKFFLHGIRYMSDVAKKRITALKEGEELKLVLEPTNPVDSNAVAIYVKIDDIQVGYVPRYLARDMHEIINVCQPEQIRFTVKKNNGEAPLQHRVLCFLESCWPENFNPCSDDNFTTIVSTSGYSS